MNGLRIVIGSDEAGYEYKEQLREDLLAHPGVSEVSDLGVGEGQTAAYPSIAVAAGELIAAGNADRALLICGTGLGMAIAANKVAHIRAVTAHDSYSVERAVLSNNAQILTMGQRVVGLELARRLAREWIDYTFDVAGASADKVKVIDDYELRERGRSHE